jgi:Proprotein convertase P-domain
MGKAFRRGLVVALAGVLVVAFAGIAGGKIKTKTFSSGTINVPIPDGSGDPASHTFGLNKKRFKRSKVKDVNVGVWIDHVYDEDVDISVTGPTGQTVDLSSDNGGAGDDYGSGTPGCGGTLTVFNDEAETEITEGAAPFAGQFKPEELLSTFDRAKVKGSWTVNVVDDLGLFSGSLRCAELEIKYKKKKKK